MLSNVLAHKSRRIDFVTIQLLLDQVTPCSEDADSRGSESKNLTINYPIITQLKIYFYYTTISIKFHTTTSRHMQYTSNLWTGLVQILFYFIQATQNLSIII